MMLFERRQLAEVTEPAMAPASESAASRAHLIGGRRASPRLPSSGRHVSAGRGDVHTAWTHVMAGGDGQAVNHIVTRRSPTGSVAGVRDRPMAGPAIGARLTRLRINLLFYDDVPAPRAPWLRGDIPVNSILGRTRRSDTVSGFVSPPCSTRAELTGPESREAASDGEILTCEGGRHKVVGPESETEIPVKILRWAD